ncbi:MAG TPA: hypothetical protein VMW23_08115 [Sedimentisphaerales bacterium]|nr:hypothetical protein [Sedimentisphaerales bacterium]
MDSQAVLSSASHLLAKRFLGPFWLRRRWLAGTQWLEKEKLQQIQLRCLKRLLSHSWQTVPYYKKLMREYGLSAERIKTLDDLKSFPILSKKDVLKAAESMISVKYPGWSLYSARTGGSTGMPLVVYRDLFSVGNEHAFVRRQWDWAGVSLADKCAYLMSRVVASAGQKDAQIYRYCRPMRELILSTFHLSAKTAKQYAEVMKRYGIRAIVGYPSAISFLASACLESGIELDLKAALTTSEILTPAMRETISRAFGCRVFDFYGGAERVCYIHTCEHGNYHLIPEYGFTELVPVPKTTNRYKVIATGFWNRAMPFIRYDTQDIVARGENSCPCGRQFEVIESIDGRQGDIIRTPSGKQLGVTLIIQLLYVICAAQNILESQVVQDRLDHLVIRFVPFRNIEKEVLDNFGNSIRKYLPDDLNLDFEKVDFIEKTSNGKVKALVSLIDN